MRIVVAIYSPILAWNIPPDYVARLARDFPEHTVRHARDDEQLLAELPEAEILCLSQITPEQFAAARRLRWIHSPAAGVGGMLFPALVASDVLVTNARGVHAIPMAEYVLGAMLSCARKLHASARTQRERRWAQDELIAGLPPMFELRGELLGLIGLGAIGREVARVAAAIGMRVWAVRRHPDAPHPPGVERVLGPGQLDDLLSAARFIVLAAPHTAETRDLIGEAQLRRMRPDAYLINVGRGKLVVEDTLVAALERGTIAGAVLDVFDDEPLPPDSRLWDAPNLLITPHISYGSPVYWDRTLALFEDNLRRFARREKLVNVVDKRVGY